MVEGGSGQTVRHSLCHTPLGSFSPGGRRTGRGGSRQTTLLATFHLLPLRLDTIDERLWRGAQTVVLRRKTFAVLRYLVEHPDQVVTKRALLDAIWPNLYVGDIV
jgi:DNA-binding response OmpR family regulator